MINVLPVVRGLASSLLWLVAIVPASANAAAGTTCDRACLRKFVDDYATAMLAKDPSAVPVTADAKVFENASPIKLGDGVWKSVQRFYSAPSSTQYVADPTTQQIARMGIIKDGETPAFWAVRLRIAGGSRISEIETLVAHEGSGGPFQPEGYLWREAPFIRTIPEKIRASRAELLDMAGKYWKIGTTTHKGADLPYSPDCIHVENGMNTDWERYLSLAESAAPDDNPQTDWDGRIWTCAREVNLTTRVWTGVRSLRFIVDEERGLVMTWNIVDKAPPAPRAGGPPAGPPGGALPFEYGPPSRAADGWPVQAGQRPAGGSGAAPAADGKTPSLYHAALTRIANGKINREQYFEVNVPADTPAPFAADAAGMSH